MEQLTKVKITKHFSIAENTYIIQFKRVFDFIPGQIIGITDKHENPPRLYSICSSPKDEFISILFNLKVNGELTPVLSELSIGDYILITEVQGKFTFNNEPAWWIGTGTGIAPFYSMFSSGQKPQKLIQGARTKNDLFFIKEFESLPDYIKCCSKDSGDGIYADRLTSYLEKFESLPENLNYYLCGSAEMVVDVRNLLISKGVPFSNIITEIYF
ncbi:MAG: oxidoreductase [Salinivirgaceae bacterium]|nr:oxidoreductase [Salinivirgaceae bacterium]